MTPPTVWTIERDGDEVLIRDAHGWLIDSLTPQEARDAADWLCKALREAAGPGGETGT